MDGPPSLEPFVHSGGVRGQIQLTGSSAARKRTLAGIALFVVLVVGAGLAPDLTLMTGLYAASFLVLVGTVSVAMGLINHPVPFELTEAGFSLNEELFPWERLTAAETRYEDSPPPGVLLLVLQLTDGDHEFDISPFQHAPEDVQWLCEQIEARLSGR